MNNYRQIRFTLFTYPYSGYFLAAKVRNNYQKNKKLGKTKIIQLAKTLKFNPRLLREFILCNKHHIRFLKTNLFPYPQNKVQISIYLRIEVSDY